MTGEWLRGRVRRLAAMLAMAGAVALAAGCGSGGARGAASAHRPPATTARGGGARLATGRALFRAHCAACHTLAEAGAHGTRAGGEANLDQIRPNSSSVANFVGHGFGKMPSFRGRLSPGEIDALARYVATADGCGTRSPTSCDPR